MNRRPEILLVTPPYHSGMVESAGSWLPLGLRVLRKVEKITREEMDYVVDCLVESQK